MLQDMIEGRPYPPTGINTRLWNELPLEHVLLAELVSTQQHLDLTVLLNGDEERHPVFVVEWRGVKYLEDGHHRVARAALRGYATHPARVFREKDRDRRSGFGRSASHLADGRVGELPSGGGQDGYRAK